MMLYFRRAMAIILSFMLMISIFGVEALAEDSSPDPSPQAVPYVNAKGVAKTPENCLPVAANMSDGWYAVMEDAEFSDWIRISGNVNLILCDGKTLKANAGVYVPPSASLTIWAQSVYTESSGTGKLLSVGNNGMSGIGPANDGQGGGTVIINGGEIDARINRNSSIHSCGIGGDVVTINGGKVTGQASYGAGIGSNFWNSCGIITINGGEVRGESGDGAGIGLGGEAPTSGQVIINGGNVTAISHTKSAGIGGGYRSHLDSITITGGTVTATANVDGGGNRYEGAGIGGGAEGESGTITISGGHVTATNKASGAAIGGGMKGDSNDITITGNATVIANCEYPEADSGAGIGGGRDGSASGTITISGNANVTASSAGGGAGIGGGVSYIGSAKLKGSIIIKENAVVTARGGNNGGAGIGGGDRSSAKDGHIHISDNARVYAYGGNGAAGIGGGRENYGSGGEGCGDVRIEGSAFVFAQSGEGSCSAIGHGDDDDYMGSITFGPDLCVKAGNERNGIEGTYEALFSTGLREEACKWRHKALIKPCDHTEDISFVYISETEHLRDFCAHCGKMFLSGSHVFDDETHTCTICGYVKNSGLVEITFNANGGGGEMEQPLIWMPTSLYTLPECGFSPPAGKTFHGWDITTTGTTEEDPVSGIHFPHETILLPGAGTVELKANWEGDTTVTIHHGNGTGEDKTVYLSKEEKYPLPTPESLDFIGPQWYSFAGWKINNDAENLKQPLEPISIEGNTTITAIWTRATRTVTFDANGGSVVEAQTVANGETVTKPANPTRNNDTFQGWYLGDEVFDFTTPVTADLTLTARWVGPWGRLQQQIDEAASGDTVTLTENVTAESYDVPILINSDKEITLDMAGYTVNRSLTEAREDGNVITVEGSLTLTDSSSAKTGKITGGNNLDRGGGVIIGNNGTLTLNGGIISGNTVPYTDGGGIYVDEGTFVMNGGTISDNKAEMGGGVQLNGFTNANFHMYGGTISNNQAYYGGGVGIDGGVFTMEDGSITGNSTAAEDDGYKYYGGGVYIISGTFRLKGGSISNNTALHGGGGVYNGCDFTMSGGSITGNTSDGCGGGVYCDEDFTMTGGSISNNKANGYGIYDGGGGVYIKHWTVFNLTDGSITGNTAHQDGGGVYITDNSELIMTNGSITGNTSRIDGGGVFLYDNSRFTMNSGSISENASESGAGVSILYNSELMMTGGTICNNTADSYGGGIYNDSTLKLSGNPKITGNTADGADDNVHLYIDKITIVNPLTSGASVGVNMNSVTGSFTTGYKAYNEGSEPSAYFSSDNDSYIVSLDDNGEAMIAIPSFGTPDFILPTGVGTIEANAFEGVTKMTIVDAQNCKEIGAEAFKGTGLKQIRLDKDCEIAENAFSGCGTVFVFAQANGKTETFCDAHEGIEFVAID